MFNGTRLFFIKYSLVSAFYDKYTSNTFFFVRKTFYQNYT